MKLVPDGIAHFLEHKMFEKEDYDVFEKFSAIVRLLMRLRHLQEHAYLFSCTSDLKKI